MTDNMVFDVPFQVQTLIDSMNNKKDGPYIRSNFRMRLVNIRNAIDAAIAAYDDVAFADRPRIAAKKGKIGKYGKG